MEYPSGLLAIAWSPPLDLVLPAVPYTILAINYLFFKLLRMTIRRIFGAPSSKGKEAHDRKSALVRAGKVLADELVSTWELIADCAELNVIHERHGSLAYFLTLCLLTYLWLDTFGEAHTSPAYLVEDFFLVESGKLLTSADTYARFAGQSLALLVAWKFAATYWTYELLREHQIMLTGCRTALNTSTLNGFLIELTCCLLCRLLELLGHQMVERNQASRRAVSLTISLANSLLVVLALDLSGGYFNPILASSLEFNCEGIHTYQHAIVFWMGPLVGHLIARLLFMLLLASEQVTSTNRAKKSPRRKSARHSKRSAQHAD